MGTARGAVSPPEVPRRLCRPQGIRDSTKVLEDGWEPPTWRATHDKSGERDRADPPATCVTEGRAREPRVTG